MNLLIDSGNSLIKWVLSKDGEFFSKGRCLSNSVSSLPEFWENYESPARVIVANVAGERVADEIKKAVSARWQLDTEFIVSSKNCCGLKNSYHKTEQLGVDRWMAMLAAYQKKMDSVIVVDCGTAVTIDVVNMDGVFIGGVILPGLNTAYQSLTTDTDVIKEISSINSVASPVAQSTEDAVAAGVLLGLVGGIERIVSEQSSLVDITPTVFLTGGDAEKLLLYLTISVTVQPDLVLQGLSIAA